MVSQLKAPFPYFGGKSKIAEAVWRALGQPKHYIEPFFGSGAVLLSRPEHSPSTHVETVNDKDGFVANVWRALQFSPDKVARWCDWPVNHADLSARKKELIKNEGKLLEGLASDPQWHDPILAGYWIWCASCWIGSGLTRLGQIPHISDGGQGVHTLGQIPHVSNSGQGVHTLGQIPHVSSGGKGVQEPYNRNLYAWFRSLSERLRYVRVVCGDWTRVCGGNWQDEMGTVGIFFDPPYGIEDRDTGIYHHDTTRVAQDVNSWALERGKKESYRIVIAGYEEHENLLSAGWRKINWTAQGGYGNLGKGQGFDNRKRETLYFSPHCMEEDLWRAELPTAGMDSAMGVARRRPQ